MKEIALKDLEEYRDQIQELDLLERRLLKEREKAKAVTADSVTGSTLSYPYTKTSFKIEGVEDSVARRANAVIPILEERKEGLHKKQLEIENHIYSIPESIIRQIVELRYIKGVSWAALSTIIYGYPCSDRCRKRIYRYYERN